MTTAWIGPMSDKEYHGDPCETVSLSGSLAKVIVKQSEAHARLQHPRLEGNKVPKYTPAMDTGSMVHDLLLLGETERVVVLPSKFDDFKTKDARTIRDAARDADRIPVIASKFEALKEHSKHVRDALAAKGYSFDPKHSEQVIFWDEETSGGGVVQCRAKLDNWAEPTIFELKTATNAHPDKVQRQIDDLGYDISAAAYTSGVEHNHPELVGRVKFKWLFVELEPPYAVTVGFQRPSLLELGKIQWKQAVDLWHMALTTDNWPDYTGDEEHGFEATPWRMRKVFGDTFGEG